MRTVAIISAIFWLFLAYDARAFLIDNRLPDPKMEARAQSLFKVTKCLVCSGESLQESNSAFASDMRALIRSEILNGHTDAEILEKLKHMYGDRILNTTPYDARTYLLWFFPVLTIIIFSSLMAVKIYKLTK